MKIPKQRSSWILWACSIAFFICSIYLFYDNLLVAGLFGLVVSFFLVPNVRALMKERHYNKNALIGIPLCAFGLMVASYMTFRPSEDDIPAALKEYTHISGTKVDSFRDMSYMVNPNLNYIEKQGMYYYYPVTDQKIPVLIVSHADHTSYKQVESFLNAYIPEQFGYDGTIDNVLTEDYWVNGRPCQMVTYAYTLEEMDKSFLSSHLIGETFLAPIQDGVYVVSLFTYANDFNDYGYSSMIETVDLYQITHFLDVQEEMKKYLKDHGCPQGAYGSECEEFTKYRNAIQTALDQGATIEEMETAKANAVTYENAIKARIQKDKEDQAYLNTLYGMTYDESAEQ